MFESATHPRKPRKYGALRTRLPRRSTVLPRLLTDNAQ